MKYRINLVKTEYGRVWTLRCVGGYKTPLLIIHGGPGFPHNYLESLKELATDRDVIFYDQLGCGYSERPTEESYRNLSYFINEIKAVRDDLDLNELIMLGHSFGAALVCEHAVAFPEGVKGVIFASPFLDTGIWMKGARKNISLLPREMQQSINIYEREGTTFKDEYQQIKQEYDKRFGLTIRPLPKEVEESNEGFDSETYRLLWGTSEFNCNGSLKNYKAPVQLLPPMPVLFTSGEYDSAKFEFLEEIRKKIPKSESMVFEKSAHMPHLEQKQEYLEAISIFLNRNRI